jgi:pimeloyl-ACP methyl ester carboxylesterase
VSIAYQVVGDGPVDLVLFPGWFSHMDLQWEIPLIARFLHRLASFSRLILFDKRGVGLSDPVSSAPTLDERMDDLHAVMDAVGCEQASIFGLSEGGTMSAMFAAAHPERVNALVLYGSWFAGPAVLAEHKQPGWQKAQAVARSLDDAVEHWGEGRMAKFMAPSVAAFPGTLEYVGAFERAALSRRMAADLWEAITHHDARSALPLIRAPTLVLHRRDEVVPIEQARYLADHIPEAQLVELQGVDHFPWIGDTESVASSVEEFVSTGRPSRKSKRVLATVLVSQIVDPDKDRPDDDLQRQSLADYQELTRRELDRYEGQRMKHPRDDVLATFSGPTRAVNCACAIRDQALRLGLEIRAALHTGECELNDETVHGAAVQIADRVINLAQPGEILTSRTVRDLLFGAEIEFDHRGEHALNELATWDIYAVGRPSQSAGTAPASDHK